MWERYKAWAYGWRMVALIAMLAILAPTAICALIIVIAELAIRILGIESFELSRHYDFIFYLSLIFFGPYYVGTKWDWLEDAAKSIKSKF